LPKYLKRGIAFVLICGLLIACAPATKDASIPLGPQLPNKSTFSVPVVVQVDTSATYTAKEYKTPAKLAIATYHIPLDTSLQEYTYKKCQQYGIPQHYELVLAMMWRESNFTVDGISATNDYGIMQINKCNHKWLQEALGVTDFLNAKQNIEAGVYMISTYLLRYDAQRALMAYNYGENSARQKWRNGIYSSSYSRDIISKRKLIEEDKYANN